VPRRVSLFPLWPIGVAVLVVMAAAPLIAIMTSFRAIDVSLWAHLIHHVLPGYASETVLLLGIVLVLTLLLGVGLAWLTTAYTFPGVRLFRWALVLPLAIPAYVLAFVYLAWFDVTGSVTAWARTAGVVLPEIRNRWGAAVTLALAFYPYVYLPARLAFASTGARALEVGQTLGLTRRAAFWQVVLPLARPAIVGGAALVGFETLADFGLVSLFGIDTLSVGIYKAWYGLFSLPTAMQIAAVLALTAMLLLALEQWARRAARYTTPGRGAALTPQPLSPLLAPVATVLCTAVLLVAWAAPLVQLVSWAWLEGQAFLTLRYASFFGHSLLLGTSGALVTAVLALFLAYAQRRSRHPTMGWAVRVALLGYALPGAVLAVGVVAVVSALDRLWIAAAKLANLPATPVLAGTIAALLAAYTVRFLVVAFQPIHAALMRITPSMDEAAQSLGASPLQVLTRVHWPLVRPALAGAAAFVFIDIVKELPITLMTRPFGWETLATRIFELTNDGRWEAAALPALAVTLAGLLPTLLLARTDPTHTTPRNSPC